MLFFIELRSRRVHLAGCSANPDGLWTTQQARHLACSLAERSRPIRFLIHDRDSKFSRAFDEVFKSERIDIIRTPFRAPNANAFAERWVGTIRRDCLDDPRIRPSSVTHGFTHPTPLWPLALQVITARARVDPAYATTTGRVLACVVPAHEVLRPGVVGRTLSQAAVTAGETCARRPTATCGRRPHTAKARHQLRRHGSSSAAGVCLGPRME